MTLLLCNREVFESWPEEVQKAVVRAAKTATAHQRQLAREQDEAVLSKLSSDENEVIVLEPEERNAFEKKVAPLLESYRAKFGPDLFTLLGL